MSEIRNICNPVICVVKDWVLGGRTRASLVVDIRVASRNGVCAAPEVTLGWVCGSDATQSLPKLVGYGQTIKALLTDEQFSADEAFRIGLVEKLVDIGKEIKRERDLAGHIATNSSMAIRHLWVTRKQV